MLLLRQSPWRSAWPTCRLAIATCRRWWRQLRMDQKRQTSWEAKCLETFENSLICCHCVTAFIFIVIHVQSPSFFPFVCSIPFVYCSILNRGHFAKIMPTTIEQWPKNYHVICTNPNTDTANTCYCSTYCHCIPGGRWLFISLSSRNSPRATKLRLVGRAAHRRRRWPWSSSAPKRHSAPAWRTLWAPRECRASGRAKWRPNWRLALKESSWYK